MTCCSTASLSAVLEALIYLEKAGYELKQKQNSKSSGKKEVYLKATGFLNIYGGTHILDYFTKDEIKAKIIEYMLSLPHTLRESILKHEDLGTYKESTKELSLHYPSIQTVLLDAHDTEPNQEVKLMAESSITEQAFTKLQPTRADEPVMEHDCRTDDSLALGESMSKAVSQMSFDEMISVNATDSLLQHTNP